MNKMLVRCCSVLALLLGLVACAGLDKSQFVVEGHIQDASGKMLYLDEVGTGEVLSLDSIKLRGDGAFRFARQGERYPMFYRLRMGEASIPFFADSLTHLVLESQAQSLLSSYRIVEGDASNRQIRDIAHSRYRTDRTIDSLIKAYEQGQIKREEAVVVVDSIAQELKRNLATHYIYVDPKSPAAYYALFQTKGKDRAYFSVDDEGDEGVFAAVATAYDTYYAEAPYTPFLKRMALTAIARRREKQAMERKLAEIRDAGLKELDYFEIKGVDQRGEERSLSAMLRSSSVLLCFTNYAAEWSPTLVTQLKELQTKRSDISLLDVVELPDAYVWRNATRTLSWSSLLDVDGKYAQLYNVHTLPAFYLIRNGELKRIQDPSELLP